MIQVFVPPASGNLETLSNEELIYIKALDGGRHPRSFPPQRLKLYRELHTSTSRLKSVLRGRRLKEVLDEADDGAASLTSDLSVGPLPTRGHRHRLRFNPHNKPIGHRDGDGVSRSAAGKKRPVTVTDLPARHASRVKGASMRNHPPHWRRPQISYGGYNLFLGNPEKDIGRFKKFLDRRQLGEGREQAMAAEAIHHQFKSTIGASQNSAGVGLKIQSELSSTPEVQLHFGRDVVLRPASGDDSLMALDMNTGLSTVLPLGEITESHRITFRLLDLEELDSFKTIMFGSRIWLLVEPGTGDPSWRQGSVLGARVYDPSALPTLKHGHGSDRLELMSAVASQGQGDVTEVASVGVPRPVRSAVPKFGAPDYGEGFMRLQNMNAISIARWIVHPVSSDGMAQPDRVGQAVQNMDFCYLEQDFFYISYDAATGAVLLKALRTNPTGPRAVGGEGKPVTRVAPVDRKGIFRLQTLDSELMGAIKREQASIRLMAKARGQLVRSVAMRTGQRNYLHSTRGGERLLGGDNFPLSVRAVTTAYTTAADDRAASPEATRNGSLRRWFEDCLEGELGVDLQSVWSKGNNNYGEGQGGGDGLSSHGYLSGDAYQGVWENDNNEGGLESVQSHSSMAREWAKQARSAGARTPPSGAAGDAADRHELNNHHSHREGELCTVCKIGAMSESHFSLCKVNDEIKRNVIEGGGAPDDPLIQALEQLAITKSPVGGGVIDDARAGRILSRAESPRDDRDSKNGMASPPLHSPAASFREDVTKTEESGPPVHNGDLLKTSLNFVVNVEEVGTISGPQSRRESRSAGGIMTHQNSMLTLSRCESSVMQPTTVLRRRGREGGRGKRGKRADAFTEATAELLLGYSPDKILQSLQQQDDVIMSVVHHEAQLLQKEKTVPSVLNLTGGKTSITLEWDVKHRKPVRAAAPDPNLDRTQPLDKTGPLLTLNSHRRIPAAKTAKLANMFNKTGMV